MAGRGAGAAALDAVSPMLRQWLDEELTSRILEIDGKLTRLSELVEHSLHNRPLLRPEVEIAGEVAHRVHAEMDGLRAASQGDVRRPSKSSSELSPADAPGSRTFAAQPESSDRQSVASLTSSKAQTWRSARSYNGLSKEFVKLVPRDRGSLLERVWSFLDEPGSSRAAGLYAKAQPPVAVVAALVSLLQASRPPLLSGFIAIIAEIFFDGIFCAEALLRCVSCPHKSSFLQNVYNVIDILAALPLILRLCTGLLWPPVLLSEDDATQGLVDEAFFWCAVPLLRLLKALRRFRSFHLLRSSFKVALEGLPVLIFTLMLMVLVFSSMILIFEPRSTIDSLPTAIWFSMVTITTVGYGEITPSTAAGHIVAGVMALCGVLYMAMPISIIGHAFTHVWENRGQILLLQRTRENLIKYGYTADNIPTLFQLFDAKEGIRLNLSEFKVMMHCVRIGLSKSCAVDLFRFIDTDGDGFIDCWEFVEKVFHQELPEPSLKLSSSADPADQGPCGQRRSNGSGVSENQYLDILEVIGTAATEDHREYGDIVANEYDDVFSSNEHLVA